MDTYQKSQKLCQLVCRVKKSESGYLYFTLEANGGIAFYSTLDKSIDTFHRDIIIHAPIELRPQLMQVLNSTSQLISIEIVSDEIIQDLPNAKLTL